MRAAAQRHQAAEDEQPERVGEEVIDPAVQQRAEHDAAESLFRARRDAVGEQPAVQREQVEPAHHPDHADDEREGGDAGAKTAVPVAPAGVGVRIARG